MLLFCLFLLLQTPEVNVPSPLSESLPAPEQRDRQVSEAGLCPLSEVDSQKAFTPDTRVLNICENEGTRTPKHSAPSSPLLKRPRRSLRGSPNSPLSPSTPRRRPGGSPHSPLSPRKHCHRHSNGTSLRRGGKRQKRSPNGPVTLPQHRKPAVCVC